MSIEDLQDAGVLLPERAWGKRALDSTMSRLGTVVAGIVAVAACFGMYAGGGRGATWISAGVFLADLFAFTLLAWRAVDAQGRRRTRAPGEAPDESRSEDGEADGGEPSGEA